MSNPEDAVMIKISNKDQKTLKCLEEELWCEETRFDTQRMNEIIANDFIEFGRSGRIYQRIDYIASIVTKKFGQEK